ncbi:glycosyltransferase [bacterium]|nr:glycosyltransferase [bacterium]
MRICVVRHASYPDDPRVRKEVAALLEAGHEVDVLCLQAAGKPRPPREYEGRLRIMRMPFEHHRASVVTYVGLYLFSVFMFAVRLTLYHRRRRYDLVQVNTMPDALVFCTLPLRLFRVPVLLDVHEPTPELWQTKYGSRLPVFYHLQLLIQNLAVGYASHVTTVSAALRTRLLERAKPRTGITVVPNVAQLSFCAGFDAAPSREAGAGLRLVTHGAIEERYGHELVIRCVHQLRREIPEISYDIIGSGAFEPQLRRLVKELDCAKYVRFHGFLSFDELRRRLRDASLGVVPMRRSPYSELIDTNKMYEFMLFGVPVLHSRLPVVEANFGPDEILFFEPDNVDSLCQAVRSAWQQPDRRAAVGRLGQQKARALAWEHVKGDYLNAIQIAADSGSSRGRQTAGISATPL